MRRPISPLQMKIQSLASTVTPEREPARPTTLTFLRHCDPPRSPQSSGVPKHALWEPHPPAGAPQAHQDTGVLPGERGQTTQGTGRKARRSCAAPEQPVLVHTI